MKHVAIAAALTFAAVPAYAMQAPTPTKGGDPKSCDVVYKDGEVLDAQAIIGNQMAITFGAKERILYVAASDSEHLKYFTPENSNILYLKGGAGADTMPSTPINVRTMKEDNTPRDYSIQWTVLPQPMPPPTVAKMPQVASLGIGVAVSEVPQPAPAPPKTCYTVRYQYPKEVSAEQAAKWQAQQAKWKTDQAEVALRRASQSPAGRNVRYMQMGDAQLAPTEIYDDGESTWLHFPGGMRIPAIYTTTQDGTEAVVTDVTYEDNGIAKIHRTLPLIRLRAGELALCMFNLAWNPIGNVPDTGTSDPNTRRTVGASR